MSHGVEAAAQLGSVALAPVLWTQFARILPSVFSRSSVSQLSGGNPPEQSTLVGRNDAGAPVEISARLSLAFAAAFSSPARFVAGAPAIWPLESINWASAHSPATVVSSLIRIGPVK